MIDQINAIKKIKLNRAGKLEVGKILYSVKDNGIAYLTKITENAGISFYTARDWLQAYETWKNLPKSKQDNYTITELKKATREKNKEEGLVYKKKGRKPTKPVLKERVVRDIIYKPKKEDKDFITVLHDTYKAIRNLKDTPENIEKAEKINLICGLIRAEAKRLIDPSDDTLVEVEEDVLDTYSYDEDIADEVSSKSKSLQ